MSKIVRIMGAGALALALLAAPVVFAQESEEEDLRKEVQALKQGQQNIQRQLAEIKRLLQAQAKPAAQRRGPEVKDVVFDVSNARIKGQASATLTLIEFTDYQ
jgi:protein-disulfide isomerase